MPERHDASPVRIPPHARPRPLSTIVVAGDPDEDARLILASLKRTPELRHIPVLAYSARARPVDEARALTSGADRFLADPAHLTGVFDVVASMHVPPVGVTVASPA